MVSYRAGSRKISSLLHAVILLRHLLIYFQFLWYVEDGLLSRIEVNNVRRLNVARVEARHQCMEPSRARIHCLTSPTM